VLDVALFHAAVAYLERHRLSSSGAARVGIAQFAGENSGGHAKMRAVVGEGGGVSRYQLCAVTDEGRPDCGDLGLDRKKLSALKEFGYLNGLTSPEGSGLFLGRHR